MGNRNNPAVNTDAAIKPRSAGMGHMAQPRIRSYIINEEKL